ncbi:hypothetical protein F5876DRAFT_70178 [Lentinula aff. lateritia]|uniref:Uncharacterized protein n=1 Tax=Lentinula aff. lateritia TaxID=2804960 RepID=A0ACC1TJX0_9AGAR|nr:hypothetical protein F5876DRAFT_70178 [Lentinula aff. lateritia]
MNENIIKSGQTKEMQLESQSRCASINPHTMIIQICLFLGDSRVSPDVGSTTHTLYDVAHEEWGTMVHAIFPPYDSCTTGTGAWIQLRVESVKEEDKYEMSSRLARTVLEDGELLVAHSIDEFIRQATDILEDPIAQYTSQPLIRLQQSLTRLEDATEVEEQEDEDGEENVDNDDSEFRIPLVSPCGEVSYRVQVQKGVHAALQVLMEMGLEL